MRISTTIPVLLSFLTLGACTTTEPTFGERLSANAANVSATAEKAVEGERQIERGEALVARGNKRIAKGEREVTEGRERIERGEALLREARREAGPATGSP